MIEVCEGLGGWTIKVKNHGKTTPFECSRYIVTDENGVNWFDIDRAMRDAQEIDKRKKENVRRT